MSDRDTLTIALAQMHSVLDWRENLDTCFRYLAEAAELGVDLLVFPETASSRTDVASEAPEAQPIKGAFVAALSEATIGTGVTLIVGITEAQPGERPFNTLVAIRDGERIASYRKIHLYDACAVLESDTIQPGDGPVSTFEVNGFTIGMMTCYDIRFPELARLLAEQGADLIAVPTSWVQGPHKEDHWNALCKARAIENTVYVAGAAQTGGNRVGLSTVVAPSGVPVASLGTEEDLVVARLDRRLLDAAREAFPLLAQRRFATSPVPDPHPAGALARATAR